MIETTIKPMVFETRTEHRGRTLDEQQSRHKQATGHNKVGKLQVREEKFERVGSGFKTRAIFVFQECLDCIPDRLVIDVELKPPNRDYLEKLEKRQLLELTQSRGLAGNKQTNKLKLINTIINSY